MSFLPNYDIEARRKAKMKSAHRVITLRPIAGRIPKNSTTGDPIRFSFDGSNRLHAQFNHNTGLWKLNYDNGSLPGGLQVSFTTFPELLDHVRVYFYKRNVEVADVTDID
jgi:hypothetical protein